MSKEEQQPLNLDLKKKLSQQDVARLINERSEEVRIDIADKITSQFNDGGLTDKERELAEHIIRFLAYQAEEDVRKTIAQNLRNNPDLPHDVALRLAKDVENVSLPILEDSVVLSSMDLVSIIKDDATSNTKHLSITKRKDISEPVSDALVETHNEAVVDNLLHNESAKIGDRSFAKIIQEFSGSQKVAESLVQRKSIPPHITAKLMSSVSAQLSKELQKKYNIQAPKIAAVVEESKEIATLNLVSPNTSRNELIDFIQRLHATEQLTPSLLILSIGMNRFNFFVTAMAIKACIPASNANTLVHDVNGLGFTSLYQKTELPERLQDSIKLLVKAAIDLNENPETKKLALGEYTNRLLERVHMYSAEEPAEGLPVLLGLIQRIPKTA
jgi:uncharacterized protein (DUF2336 family)